MQDSIDMLQDDDIEKLIKMTGGNMKKCIGVLNQQLENSKKRHKRETQKIEAYRTLANLSSLHLSTEKAMELMVKSASRILRAHKCSLFTVETRSLPQVSPRAKRSGIKKLDLALIPENDSKIDGENKYLLCHIADEDFEGSEVEWGKGLVGTVAQTSKTINIANAYEDERFCQDFDKKSGYRTRSILTVPIIAKKSVVGVIQAINKMGPADHFSDDDVVILETIANNAGAIIREKRALQSLKNEERRGKFLMQLMAISNEARESSLSLRRAASRVQHYITDMLQAASTTIYLVDHHSNTLLRLADDKVLSSENSIPAHVMQNQSKSLVEANATESEVEVIRKDAIERGIHSIICMLVGNQKKPLAVLEVVNKMEAPTLKSSTSFLLSPEKRRSSMMRKSSTDQDSLPHVAAFSKDDVDTLEITSKQIRNILHQYADAGTLGAYLNHNQITTSLIEMHKACATTRRTLHHQMSSIGLDLSRVTIRLDNKVNLDDPDFNVFEHTDEELLRFAIEIFSRVGVESAMRDTYKTFLLSVRQRYQDNPFHNWKHAFSVFYHTYLLYREVRDSGSRWSHSVVLYLLVSAICHDVGHPGNTNDYEINSQTERASRYNHQSVLENHHCFVCMQILRNPKTNVFKDHTGAKLLRMKNTIIKLILATDMKHHFSMQQRMRSIAQKKKNKGQSEPSDERQSVMEMVIHSADLANQGLKWGLANVWADRVCDEFQAQAEKEVKGGLPVAPFMKGLDTPMGRAKLQMSFIDAILVPWWDVVKDNIESSKLVEGMCENLANNRKKYSEVKSNEKQLSSL